MIDDIPLEFDGQRYVWTCDSDNPRPDHCWNWSDSHCMKPPAAIIARLNRHFIDSHASALAKTIRQDQLEWLEAVLRSMGASVADLEKPGMELMLWNSNPKRVIELLAERHFEPLPPATHSPFNCRELRDWAFNDQPQPINLPHAVTCIGDRPFEFQDFVNFLAVRKVTHEPTLPNGHVILGREGWDGSEIDSVIDQHRGSHLCI